MDVISVIIPVYNSEKYLDECLKSVLNQTYHSLEVIIVDDGSKDSSLSICKKYQIDNRVKVFQKENGGASSARNMGMDHATGKYICFVNSDDIIDPDTYALCMEAFEKYNPDYVVYDIKTEYGHIRINNDLEGLHDESYITDLFDNYSTGKFFSGYPTNKVWKREKLSSLRFNTYYKIAEDALFNWESMKLLKSAVYIPKKCYHYRYALTGLSKSNSVYKINTAVEVAEILRKEALEIGTKSIPSLCMNRIGANIKMVKAIVQTGNHDFDWHVYREKLLEDKEYFGLMDMPNKISIFLIKMKCLLLLRLWSFVELSLKKVYLCLYRLKGAK